MHNEREKKNLAKPGEAQLAFRINTLREVTSHEFSKAQILHSVFKGYFTIKIFRTNEQNLQIKLCWGAKPESTRAYPWFCAHILLLEVVMEPDGLFFPKIELWITENKNFKRISTEWEETFIAKVNASIY